MTGSKKVIKSDKVDEELSLEAKLDLEERARVSGMESGKVISSKQKHAGEVSEILEKAHHEADRIKKRAKKIYLEVEKRVEEASAKGYEDGKAEGVQALTELAINMQKKNQELLASLERQAVELVFEMGRKIIGDSFVTDEESLLGMIRQGLQASMGDKLIVLVHPEDFQRIQDKHSRLMSVLHGSQTLTLKPAETVPINGCVIESEMGTLEANLNDQLEVIKKALGLEEHDDE